MAVILVILDGISDRPWPALGGLTPLEAAKTPNLDRLASLGETGLMHPLGRGVAPDSDLAHFTLFGYPRELYPGRALFEAVGEYMEPEPGEMVARALFSTVERQADGTLLVVSRSADISDDEGTELAEAIWQFTHGGLELEFAYNSGHQGLVLVRRERGAEGPRPSADITDGDPYLDGHLVTHIRPLDDARDPVSALATADALSAWLTHAHDILEAHPVNAARRERGERPANFLLVRWPSAAATLPRFEQVTGMLGASVSSGVEYCGLATALGMRWYGVDCEPDWGDDLRMRLDVATRAVDDCEFVHVHTKAPDDAAHAKDPERKRDVIEKLDEGLAALWDNGLVGDENLVIVTSDHGTPSGTDLIHSGDPVPVVLVGPGTLPDDVDRFGERPCAKGGLGHISGSELMPIALNAIGRIKYTGARLTAEGGMFWPREIEPMRTERE